MRLPSFRSLACMMMFVFAADVFAADPAPVQKKVIEFGWDEPDTELWDALKDDLPV